MLRLKLARLPIKYLPSWRHGAFSRKISGKNSKNKIRNRCEKSDGTRDKTDKSKCPLPDPNVCKPPTATSPGRSAGQKDAFFCYPDYRSGKPNLSPRGCLPWEKGIELCPNKEPVRTLQSPTCQHICEPYIGQGFIDKMKVSVCEYRRFEKCFEKENDPQKCLSSGSKLGCSRKEYPMMHAAHKKALHGCPIRSHQFVKPQNKTEI